MEYFIGFIILLGVLISVHELGHFLVAKALGVKVLKFSLGFPPKMVSKKWGETEYILGWVPLGGYVKMLGEDPDSDDEISAEDAERAFSAKPLLSRVAVVAAGPLSNFALAIVLFTGAYMAGRPVLISEIGSVKAGSAAQEAGLVAGDRILAVDGKRAYHWNDMRDLISRRPGERLVLTLERGEATTDVPVTPRLAEKPDELGRRIGLIGISPSGKTVTLGVFASIREGWNSTARMTGTVLVTLSKLVTGQISPKALSGPITIVQASGEFLKAGTFSFIFLVSYISINLAIINLLPVPVLDGGHLLFFGIEAITRRPVTTKIREVSTQLGLLFIIFLMALVFYNDITRLLQDGWTLPK